MLNLLVAFVSEAFNIVNENRRANSYKEKAQFIVDSYTILSEEEKGVNMDPNEMLVVIEEKEHLYSKGGSGDKGQDDAADRKNKNKNKGEDDEADDEVDLVQELKEVIS